MKTLDDEELIKTLELARKIGCEESFLDILLKEVKRRNLQYNQDHIYNSYANSTS